MGAPMHRFSTSSRWNLLKTYGRRNRRVHCLKVFNREGKFFVYIVECCNGTYYTGSTNNLENRLKLHNSNQGAKYLKGKLPVKLVYAKEYRYYKNALHAERNLKKLTRFQKQNLIKRYQEIKCFQTKEENSSRRKFC